MNLLERYEREISLELDANTVKNYKSYLNTFFKFLKEEKNVENIDDIIYLLNKEKRYLVNDYKFYLLERYASGTVNSYLIGLYSFITFLDDMGEVNKENIMPKVIKVKYKAKKEKEVLTLDEVKKVLKQMGIRTKGDRDFEYNSLRNKVIFSLEYTIGLRATEFLNLKLDQIEENETGLFINTNAAMNKTENENRLPIVGLAEKYFKEYMLMRKEMGIKSDLVICKKDGSKLTKEGTANMIKKYVKLAGINKNISNHNCRHFLATYLSNQNVNDDKIKAILGQENNDVLNKYYKKTKDTKEYDNMLVKTLNIL